MTLEKARFGPLLRTARERRGISLAQMAAETKLGAELWADLEESNLTRWPKQIYARSYVREYAFRVGMDPDETVNEFCRLFPEWGDRRTEPLLRAHAAMNDHKLVWQDLPPKTLRRASDRAARSRPFMLARHRTRIIAAAVDLAASLAVGWVATKAGATFWPALAVGALAYGVAGTLFSTHGFGVMAAERLIRLARVLPEARRRLVSSRAS